MLTEFLSSPRKLASVFRKGRDAWKDRAQEQQRRAKALDGKVRDLIRSRDRWKAEAKKLKQQLREVEQTPRPVAASAGTELAVPPVGATAGRPAIRGGSAAPLFCPLPSGRASRSI